MLQEERNRLTTSRKENCLDNAMIENFFEPFKSERLYPQAFQFRENFKHEYMDQLD